MAHTSWVQFDNDQTVKYKGTMFPLIVKFAVQDDSEQFNSYDEERVMYIVKKHNQIFGKYEGRLH